MGDVVKAAPKKIVICCDGTWQSSVSGKPSLPSNITRMARTIAKAGKDTEGKVWEQIVYYDAGIGTETASKLESSVQGATGEGLIGDVLEAYNFVVNNYSPGDKIYCFGFSRGSTTARAVAGMITDLGVIKPQFMKFFPYLLDAYKKNIDKRTFRKTKEYFECYHGWLPLVPESKQNEPFKMEWYHRGIRATAGEDIEWDQSRTIELVGVFDTVQSLGLGDTYIHSHASSRRQYEWLNVKWSPYIKHAFHALALDDRRQPFLPTLYYIPNEQSIDEEKKALEQDEVDRPELKEHRQKIDQELIEQQKRVGEELKKQKCPRKIDLVQVWFTGVHINVGGGSDDAEADFEGLANITFAWMVEQCRPYLAFEDFTNETIANYLNRVAEQSHEQKEVKDKKDQGEPGLVQRGLHAISEYWPGHAHEKMVKPKRVEYTGMPLMLSRYWAGYRAQDSYSLVFQAIHAPENRAPGASDDRSAESHRFLHKLGKTNEYMHPSVKYRLEQSAKQDTNYIYKSTPLEAFKYMQEGDKKDGVYGWFRKDGLRDVWIPEWPVLAVLESEGTNQGTSGAHENSELALIDSGFDRDEARKFLSDHAKTWKEAYP